MQLGRGRGIAHDFGSGGIVEAEQGEGLVEQNFIEPGSLDRGDRRGEQERGQREQLQRPAAEPHRAACQTEQQQHGGARFWHGGSDPRLAEVALQDAKVGQVHLRVSIEIALGQGVAGAKVACQNAEVGEVHLAVAVGVAGQRRSAGREGREQHGAFEHVASDRRVLELQVASRARGKDLAQFHVLAVAIGERVLQVHFRECIAAARRFAPARACLARIGEAGPAGRVQAAAGRENRVTGEIRSGEERREIADHALAGGRVDIQHQVVRRAFVLDQALANFAVEAAVAEVNVFVFRSDIARRVDRAKRQ